MDRGIGELYWGKFSSGEWSKFSKVNHQVGLSSGPSLAVVNDQLVCILSGVGEELYYGVFDKTPNGLQWRSLIKVPNQYKCRGEQALCVSDSKLFCVYTAAPGS